MKTLGVIANCSKPQAPMVLGKLARGAGRVGIALASAGEAAELLGPGCRMVAGNALFDVVDGVMVLGGDGTMLSAARALAGRPLPLIGVNIGSLGFMTSVAEDDLERVLDCLAADAFEVSPRAVADCVVERDGVPTKTYRALNDVVISNGASSRVVTLNVAVDGALVTSYVCDGLILGTPTGSTGHSMSAGGPIVAPHAPVLVMSVICPHTLSSRPLVIPDTSEIRVACANAERVLVLAVDGQVGQELTSRDAIIVRRSPSDVQFIHLPGYDYFAVLRQKLNWSGSSVRTGSG
jgi:NAD+ kinase